MQPAAERTLAQLAMGQRLVHGRLHHVVGGVRVAQQVAQSGGVLAQFVVQVVGHADGIHATAGGSMAGNRCGGPGRG
jgi:hypothetical protein